MYSPAFSFDRTSIFKAFSSFDEKSSCWHFYVRYGHADAATCPTSSQSNCIFLFSQKKKDYSEQDTRSKFGTLKFPYTCCRRINMKRRGQHWLLASVVVQRVSSCGVSASSAFSLVVLHYLTIEFISKLFFSVDDKSNCWHFYVRYGWARRCNNLPYFKSIQLHLF